MDKTGLILKSVMCLSKGAHMVFKAGTEISKKAYQYQKEHPEIRQKFADNAKIAVNITEKFIRENVNKYKKANIEILTNEEIRIQFINTFDIAQDEICISSPWISDRVMDKAMFDRMTRTLRRGVKIKIIYEYYDYKIHGYSQETLNNARKMESTFSSFGDLFVIKRINTHKKLLICDNKYYINASYNFLSFSGDYSNENTRSEEGIYTEDRIMIAKCRNKNFNF